MDLTKFKNYTPGPWEVRGNEPWVIAKATGDMKSVIHTDLPKSICTEQRSNIKLMAAAPELLEYCKHLLIELEKVKSKVTEQQLPKSINFDSISVESLPYTVNIAYEVVDDYIKYAVHFGDSEVTFDMKEYLVKELCVRTMYMHRSYSRFNILYHLLNVGSYKSITSSKTPVNDWLLPLFIQYQYDNNINLSKITLNLNMHVQSMATKSVGKIVRIEGRNGDRLVSTVDEDNLIYIDWLNGKSSLVSHIELVSVIVSMQAQLNDCLMCSYHNSTEGRHTCSFESKELDVDRLVTRHCFNYKYKDVLPLSMHTAHQ